MKIKTVWPGGLVEIADPPEELPIVISRSLATVPPGKIAAPATKKRDSYGRGLPPWLEEYIKKAKEQL